MHTIVCNLCSLEWPLFAPPGSGDMREIIPMSPEKGEELIRGVYYVIGVEISNIASGRQGFCNFLGIHPKTSKDRLFAGFTTKD